MKWKLAAVLLLGTHATLEAQNLPVNDAVVPPAGGFELKIQAPEDVKVLLERHLELLRYRDLTDLNDGELARLLTTAQQNAHDLLATLGYFAPDIRVEQQKNNSTGLRVVQLSVVPGEPTRVRTVRVDFSGPITNDPLPLTQRQQIEDLWSLSPGLRFTQAGWDSAKQRALRQLTSQRFPTGQFTHTRADIDPENHSADLYVTLESGPRFRLGALLISGIQRYDPETVTRLTRLAPGSDYDQTQLVEAQQRLTDSGYFDSVFVSMDTAADPQAAPVQVQLREAPLQKLVLGIGASTDSGARVSVEHTHHKVPGIDWRAVTKLSVDRETRALGTEWTAPPDESNWRWVTAALLQNQSIGSFDTGSQRLRAGRSQSGERIDRNYYLQYDRARTAGDDGTAVSSADSLSANYAFTVRNFDSLPFPSHGWGFGMEVGGGTTLGQQRDPYGRVLARWLSYQPLGQSSLLSTPPVGAGRLALRAEAGGVLAREGIALPSTQLFLTGGDSSVRGYSYHDIGVSLADGSTTAGRYLAVGSLEWQHPITANGRLTEWEGTLFMDAGAIADKPGDLHAKIGVGAGVRWKSPVGPLQMDLAYGVAVQRLRLHLNVGFTF